MTETNPLKLIKEQTLSFKIRKRLLSVRFLIFLFLIGMVGTVGFWLFWRSVPVAYVARAQKGISRDIVLGTITIQEYHLLQLRNERSGVVLETLVEIGDTVKRGQVLMRINTEEHEIKLEKLLIEKHFSAEIDKLPHEAKTKLRKMKGKVKRLKQYVEEGRSPPYDLKNAERDLKRMQDNYARELLKEDLEKEIRNIEIAKIEYGINRMTILSPVDGTIVNIFARKGNLVDQSQVVIEIIDPRRLVVAEISQDDLDKVTEGLPAIMHINGFPDETFDATVGQIMPTADPIKERYKSYLDVVIDKKKLVPGLTGKVSIIVDERKDAIFIPAQALIGDHVLRVNGSRIEMVKIIPGFRSMLKAEILEGLQEGDIVVTEYLTQFKNKQLVRKEWD